jgi:peptide/nickel transport system permease protein
MILGEFATPDALAAVSRELGLDRPVAVQFATWLGGVLEGDWGRSMRMSQPVLSLVGTAFARSMLLAGCALLLVTAIAIPLGVVAALRRGKASDVAVGIISYLGVSLPEFVTATLLIVLLAGPDLGWFPAGGYRPLGEDLLDGLRHLVLPVATLAIILVAHISRQMRSELIDVLQTDYVRTAELKGLPRRVVLLRHALRNAMIPTVTVIALDVGYLVGGIIVVEEVFAFPGIGRLLIFAIQNRDLPLIQGAALAMAATYALANLAADLIYAWLDRRIQYA